MKFEKEVVLHKLMNPGIVPLFYNDDYDLCKRVITACYVAGLRAFEFTNRGIHSPAIFEKLSVELKKTCPDLALGIGTVFTLTDAKIFYEMGADFLVQPICNAEVGDYCKSKNTTWIPGAMTLNEIYFANHIGADVVKVFPASTLGLDYIKAIKGPLPNVNLMVTGGVEPTEKNLNDWFSAGAKVCGLGSQLFNSEEKINDLTPTLMKLISSLKK